MKELNKLLYNFLWNDENDKIRRSSEIIDGRCIVSCSSLFIENESGDEGDGDSWIVCGREGAESWAVRTGETGRESTHTRTRTRTLFCMPSALYSICSVCHLFCMPSVLYAVTNTLLVKSISTLHLTNIPHQSAHFFTDKIELIRQKLDATLSLHTDTNCQDMPHLCWWNFLRFRKTLFSAS